MKSNRNTKTRLVIITLPQGSITFKLKVKTKSTKNKYDKATLPSHCKNCDVLAGVNDDGICGNCYDKENK